jgi:hypothetical protein
LPSILIPIDKKKVLNLIKSAVFGGRWELKSLGINFTSVKTKKKKKMIKITFFIAALLFFIAAFAAAQEGTYNYTDAVDAVYYSKISYCELKHIESWQCTACPKFPGMQNITGTQVEWKASTGWVGYDAPKNRIVLSFRGLLQDAL